VAGKAAPPVDGRTAILRLAGNLAAIHREHEGNRPLCGRIISRARSGGVLALIALSALASAGRADALSIEPIAQFTDNPNALIVRDVNGDHIPDVLAASSCSLHVVYGQASGTFQVAVDHPLPSGNQLCTVSPASLAVGDVDGDGRLDAVVVRNLFSYSVLVLPGKSDGTLGDPTWVGSVSYQHGVALGDLNDDGRDDITTLSGNGFTSVLLADPAGGFKQPASYQQAYQQGGGIATGLFNDDVHVDVAVGVEGYCAGYAPDCQRQNGVIEYLGNGDGTLGSPVTENGWYLTAAQFGATAARNPWNNNLLMPPAQILATPLRGLPRDDMIVTSPLVQTLLPSAAGALGPAEPPLEAGGRGDVGDLDLDGATDVGLAGYEDVLGANAALLLGDGAGGFDVEIYYALSAFGPLDAQIAEINDDAWPDLIVLAGNEVFAALNTPTAAGDPDELQFGALDPGTQSSPLSVSVVNVGPRPLQVAGSSLTGAQAGDFRIASDQCTNALLAVLESCDITVTFTPGAAGDRAGELDVASDDPDGPLTIPLAGAGTSPAPSSTVAPTPTPTAAAQDTTAPGLKVKVRHQHVRAVLKQGLKLQIGCSEACTLTLRARVDRRQAKSLQLRAPARGLLVSKRVVKLARAGTQTLVLKLSDALRRAARRTQRLRLQLAADAVDSAGNHAQLLRETVRLSR
jgi:hypothetical protein